MESLQQTEKRKQFLISFFYFAVILAIAIFFCRYAVPAILPFVIALVVSLLIKPLIRFLSEKCRIHKGVAGVVVVLLFYALIGFLLTILGIRLFASVKAFLISLPQLYHYNIAPWLEQTLNALEAFAKKLDPETAATFDVVSANVINTVGETLTALSKKLVGGVTSFTLRTPKLLLNALITIIATVFLSVDWSTIKEFVLRQFSGRTQGLLHSIRTHLGRTLGRYVRSYALILFITFVELSIGLSIVGVKNAIGLSAVIAVFDILPVVGSGTVLIPWSIISLIGGDYLRALGLMIVYVVILIVRNIIEPKIVGDRVGLHPIVTLMSMVVGTYVFGPIGLLGLPVTLALVQSLNEEGVIHAFRRKPPAGSDEADGDAPQTQAHPDESDAADADGLPQTQADD